MAAKQGAAAAVPLADLVRRHGRRGRGAERYRLSRAVFAGRAHPGALVVNLSLTRRDGRAASLEVPLERVYERLTATLARDDVAAARGPGAAHFELYADGRMVFRTAAPLLSPSTPVRTPVGARVRTAPERIDVPLRGVRRLELVTRYALDVSQEAPGVAEALGCVWADVLLYAALPAAEPARDRKEALRAALRPAMLRFASAAAATVRGAAGRLPVPVALHVLPAPRGAPKGGPSPGDLLGALGDTAREPRLGGSAVFAPLDRRRAAGFERAYKGFAEKVADDDARFAAALRAAAGTEAGAVLLASLVVPAAGSDAWSVTLRGGVVAAQGTPPSSLLVLPKTTITLPKAR